MASNRKFFVAGNWKTVDTVSHNVFCKQGLTKVPKIIRNDFSSSYGLKSPLSSTCSTSTQITLSAKKVHKNNNASIFGRI